MNRSRNKLFSVNLSKRSIEIITPSRQVTKNVPKGVKKKRRVTHKVRKAAGELNRRGVKSRSRRRNVNIRNPVKRTYSLSRPGYSFTSVRKIAHYGQSPVRIASNSRRRIFSRTPGYVSPNISSSRDRIKKFRTPNGYLTRTNGQKILIVEKSNYLVNSCQNSAMGIGDSNISVSSGYQSNKGYFLKKGIAKRGNMVSKGRSPTRGAQGPYTEGIFDMKNNRSIGLNSAVFDNEPEFRSTKEIDANGSGNFGKKNYNFLFRF